MAPFVRPRPGPTRSAWGAEASDAAWVRTSAPSAGVRILPSVARASAEASRAWSPARAASSATRVSASPHQRSDPGAAATAAVSRQASSRPGPGSAASSSTAAGRPAPRPSAGPSARGRPQSHVTAWPRCPRPASATPAASSRDQRHPRAARAISASYRRPRRRCRHARECPAPTSVGGRHLDGGPVGSPSRSAPAARSRWAWHMGSAWRWRRCSSRPRSLASPRRPTPRGRGGSSPGCCRPGRPTGWCPS